MKNQNVILRQWLSQLPLVGGCFERKEAPLPERHQIHLEKLEQRKERLERKLKQYNEHYQNAETDLEAISNRLLMYTASLELVHVTEKVDTLKNRTNRTRNRRMVPCTAPTFFNTHVKLSEQVVDLAFDEINEKMSYRNSIQESLGREMTQDEYRIFTRLFNEKVLSRRNTFSTVE